MFIQAIPNKFFNRTIYWILFEALIRTLEILELANFLMVYNFLITSSLGKSLALSSFFVLTTIDAVKLKSVQVFLNELTRFLKRFCLHGLAHIWTTLNHLALKTFLTHHLFTDFALQWFDDHVFTLQACEMGQIGIIMTGISVYRRDELAHS